MTDYKHDLIAAFDDYCLLTGRSPNGVSSTVMNDGKFYRRIKAGGGFTIKTYEMAMTWFQNNTPKTKSKKPRSN